MPLLSVVVVSLPAAVVGSTNTLVTRWTATVSATNVFPEYPRPQFVREQWQNLNGLWDYAITDEARRPPAAFTGRILVPFAVESRLSGVEQRFDERKTLWYRRRFTLRAAWRGQQVQLHFGAVDWAAEVWLNGRRLGAHRGGYDAFSFDLSASAVWDRENELLVAVTDPIEGDQPRGKQSRKPEGIFYTATSGIWQTVWLEPVPAVRLSGLSLVPDFNASALRATAMVNSLEPDVRVEIRVSFDGEPAGKAEGKPGVETVVPLRLVRPWSPDQPSLYDVEIRVARSGRLLDAVRSYFGLRDIRLGSDESGARRLFLNGQPRFQMGVLDQGFWPDGLYTAPSDEALRYDLETARRLGFNLVRKHVKVEPERWYYWADRLGLLVWQDMPSGNNASEAGRRQFETELQRLIEQKANHPCIVMWVLFNEGWGQFETERLVRRVKVADPTRLVDNASGWTDMKAGDVLDLHSYPDPLAPAAEPIRARVLGEFGGLGLGVEQHTWSQQTWGYKGMGDSDRLTRQYGLLLDKVWELQKTNGLAAAVYTQLTDVETECNGFLTYDRAVLKMDAGQVRRANLRGEFPRPENFLLPDARLGAFAWSYTTNRPPPDWMQPAFSCADWPTGPGGFGTRLAPAVIANTKWDTPDIWLRREWTMEKDTPAPSALAINHDEDAEVYLNGVLAAHFIGFSVGYMEFQISAEAKQALRPGRNIIAIHCHQTTGGQYIDAGLVGGSSPP